MKLLLLLLTSLFIFPLSIEAQEVFVDRVENRVVIGKLAGNRNLSFGVRNVLEEYLMEADYDLFPNAKNKINVEIVFLDVLTTSRNISIFSKRSDAVVIRLRGVLQREGEVVKEVVVEESSAEVSMATLVIDNGGNFNQTSLSNALKKACEKLIEELHGEL
jgi:hypothetical protein|tara:strand:- start:30 stop:512 length:483 start_codon:yes stop_codon:yes gene_type:complete